MNNIVILLGLYLFIEDFVIKTDFSQKKVCFMTSLLVSLFGCTLGVGWGSLKISSQALTTLLLPIMLSN